jgi:sRNA-binding carbon storage regulator CsrA
MSEKKCTLKIGILFLISLISLPVLTSALLAKTIYGNVNESTERQAKQAPKEIRIIFDTELHGRLATEGKQVEAHLEKDLKIDNDIIAPAGSIILGSVENIEPSRKLMKSVLTRKERFKRHGSLAINFNKIITSKKEQINIALKIPEQVSVFNNNGKYRQIIIGATGEVLKAEETDNFHPFGELTIPKNLAAFKDRHEIHILPGDHLKVELTDIDRADLINRLH